MPTLAIACAVVGLLLLAVSAQPKYCTLPPDSGPCQANKDFFFYNIGTEACEKFTYGGCHGNDNRFVTKQECEQTCNGTSALHPPIDTCLLPRKTTQCRSISPSFFYNSTSGMCESFDYGGCDGNNNRFETRRACEKRCDVTSTLDPQFYICFLPLHEGLCRAFLRRFFYNSTSERCEPFIYGECGGNDNRFETRYECEKRCNQGFTNPLPTDTASTPWHN